MTDQEINIKIAEACGWTECAGLPLVVLDKDLTPHKRYPSYCTDLNVMHEAEKVLTLPEGDKYGRLLAELTIGPEFNDEGFSPNGWGYLAVAKATARQRAEAFLRTIGKWKE
jgi:hypothetical protein